MKKDILWQPSDDFKSNSGLSHYINWLAKEKKLVFRDYDELWNWSTIKYQDFWLTILEYFNVNYEGTFDSVITGSFMWEMKWFEGIRLSYARQIFRMATTDHPAMIFANEQGNYTEISWKELKSKVASFAFHLRSVGVKPGDTVVAFMPNIPEASIAFLAVNSVGAVWSSASPDFGVDSIVSRFAQINPKVFIAVDGYHYNGKAFDKTETIAAILENLPEVEELIIFKYLDKNGNIDNIGNYTDFEDCISNKDADLEFEMVPFNHPIWVLYSSGTTGLPKAITHSVGGCLIEHLKYLTFHNDVKPGERFFWFSTTGWMMWNFVQASFLAGATIVIYDGSPAYPDIDVVWSFAEKAQINHFGTSAPFITACMKAGINPKEKFNLSSLRSLSSTGSPLPPEGFKWVYDNVKEDIWLVSMSGGTDVCTAFVGGNPLLDVLKGEIQCRALGASVYSFDNEGNEVYDEVGEMVITKPMPSMPIYFWNDRNNERYIKSYFSHFPYIWRHGDWIEISSESKGLTILGRSDATLNRQGIRIGTAEIYRAVDMIDEVKDCLIVNLELKNGDHYMPLFVVLKEGFSLTDQIVTSIKMKLRSEYSPRHIPDEIIQVQDIPYTLSGKKMEEPVKKILLGMNIDNILKRDSIRNPQSLSFFIDFAGTVKS